MRNTFQTVLFLTAIGLQSGFGQTQQVVAVSNSSASDPEEVTIAINPVNPQIVAAGSNINYFYRSTNGGTSWTQSTMPAGTWGDPCIIFDGTGNLLYATLTNQTGGYFIDRLRVNRWPSTGTTWAGVTEVGLRPPRAGQDKEWLVADMTNSPYKGNIYMSWTEFDSYASKATSDSSRVRFSRSTNGGQTWSAPIYISDKNGDCLDSSNTVEGAVPCVGPNGEVYVAWNGPAGFALDKSVDGGVTFGKDSSIIVTPGGWCFLIPGLQRANGMPIICCDLSTSPYRGNLYICWSDLRNGAGNPDIFLIKSTDGGKTWGTVKKVNNDNTTRVQFFPWMCVDQVTGAVYIVFYDRRNTTGNATEVYLARSIDGGETFENIRINQTAFTPNDSVFFGDYTNIAARNNVVYPIWMRMDNKTTSIWTAVVTFPTATTVLLTRPVTSATLYQNMPNPVTGATTIWYAVAKEQRVALSVFTASGRKISTLVNEIKKPGNYSVLFSRNNLANGVYYYAMESNGGMLMKSMVITGKY
jgi:hypothetical protein